MLAALLAAVVAVPLTPASDTDRHAGTRMIEGHRALQADQRKARTAASELYHYATHHPALEPERVRTMTADLHRTLDVTTGRLAAVRDALTPDQRKEVATELGLMTERHGTAASALTDLEDEVGRPQPDSRAVRFHTSAVYGALAGAADAHERLMQRLNVNLVERTAARTR